MPSPERHRFAGWCEESDIELIDGGFSGIEEKELLCEFFVCPDVVGGGVFIKRDDRLCTDIGCVIVTLVPSFSKVDMDHVERLEVNVMTLVRD